MPDSKPEAVSATALIDARIDAQIASLQDWRGPMLASLRRWIKAADPGVIEEWKWRGVPVWSHNGIICTVETARPSAVHWQRAQGGGDAGWPWFVKSLVRSLNSLLPVGATVLGQHNLRLHPITPSRRAHATAWVGLRADSLRLMLRRWVRTVLSLTNSLSALALLL